MSFPVDSEPFQTLLRKWPGRILQYLRKHYYQKLVLLSERRTNNRQASEEIVQEAFLEVWKKSEWLAKQNGLMIGAYLVGIVKNKSITYYHRSQERETNQPNEILDALESRGLSRESEIMRSDKYKRLRDVVSSLSEKESICVEMKYFLEMSNDAIAEKLGISKKTVEKRLTSALKNLRRKKGIID